jgi:hypothetical protein
MTFFGEGVDLGHDASGSMGVMFASSTKECSKMNSPNRLWSVNFSADGIVVCPSMFLGSFISSTLSGCTVDRRWDAADR